MDPLRWGVLSTANIGRKAVAPAIRAARNGELVAVASRDAAAAAAYARELDVPRAHGSYQALLDDPGIDAVYIPLPNTLHLPWTVRAIEAGKHVLCEKPLAPSVADCEAMGAAAAAHGVTLMEAFMYRFHPRTEAVLEAVRGGALGELTWVRAVFTFALRDRNNIRLDPELAGGALLDVGCYCVTAARSLFGRDPLEAQAFARVGPTGVDEELVATLRFSGDAFAQFGCALTLDREEGYTAVGSEGRLEVPRAFLPGTGPCEWRLHRPGAEPETHRHDGVDQYRLMVEHFGEVVLHGAPLRSGADEAARTLRVIEALQRSAREGGRPAAISQG